MVVSLLVKGSSTGSSSSTDSASSAETGSWAETTFSSGAAEATAAVWLSCAVSSAAGADALLFFSPPQAARHKTIAADSKSANILFFIMFSFHGQSIWDH